MVLFTLKSLGSLRQDHCINDMNDAIGAGDTRTRDLCTIHGDAVGGNPGIDPFSAAT